LIKREDVEECDVVKGNFVMDRGRYLSKDEMGEKFNLNKTGEIRIIESSAKGVKKSCYINQLLEDN